MNSLHSSLVMLHIITGTLALLTFWIPVFSRKGSTTHRQIGKVYAYAMYSVGLTALLSSMIRLFNPLSLLPLALQGNVEATARFVATSEKFGVFLAALAVLVVANVRHGLLVLEARQDRQALRQAPHQLLLAALSLLGAFGIYYGLRHSFLLLQIFGPLCLFNALGMFYYSYKPSLKKAEWVIEHLNNLLGAGVATHTAVIVFGAARLVNSALPVSLNILPWVAPGLIGVIASTLWARHYRKKFGHNEAKATGSAITASS